MYIKKSEMDASNVCIDELGLSWPTNISLLAPGIYEKILKMKHHLQILLEKFDAGLHFNGCLGVSVSIGLSLCLVSPVPPFTNMV